MTLKETTRIYFAKFGDMQRLLIIIRFERECIIIEFSQQTPGDCLFRNDCFVASR